MDWKEIIGYEGIYEISSIGIVKSVDRYVYCDNNKVLHLKEKIMKTRIDKYGYIIVDLAKDNIKRTFKVHRLVANAFLSNPYNYTQVNHKNGNKADNNVENLEWCTPKENTQHAVKYGLIKTGKDNNRSKQIIQYNKKGMFIKKWDCINDVSRHLFIFDSSIIKCCQRKQKTAGGFIWRYANEQQ